jgi:hypothetical protein
MRWAGHVASTNRTEKCPIQFLLLQNLKRGEHLGDLGIDGKLIIF